MTRANGRSPALEDLLDRLSSQQKLEVAFLTAADRVLGETTPRASPIVTFYLWWKDLLPSDAIQQQSVDAALQQYLGSADRGTRIRFARDAGVQVKAVKRWLSHERKPIGLSRIRVRYLLLEHGFVTVDFKGMSSEQF
ncbi:MAG: hypothetical protein V1778_01875, partial [bacterium]